MVSECDSVWILEPWQPEVCDIKGLEAAMKGLQPSCHFSAHIVSIIQIGSVGSIMAIAMFPKQMAPVGRKKTRSGDAFWSKAKRSSCIEGLLM